MFEIESITSFQLFVLVYNIHALLHLGPFLYFLENNFLLSQKVEKKVINRMK